MVPPIPPKCGDMPEKARVWKILMFSKPLAQIFFAALLAAATLCFLIAIIVTFKQTGLSGKMLSSSGLLFALSGLMQLEVSGLFEDIKSIYADEDRYPFGPPHHITRMVIEEASGNPILSRLKHLFLSQRRTGFILISLGEMLQLFGMWL